MTHKLFAQLFLAVLYILAWVFFWPVAAVFSFVVGGVVLLDYIIRALKGELDA